MRSGTVLVAFASAVVAVVGWQVWSTQEAAETLGLATSEDVVAFDDVAAAHFTALAVDRSEGGVSERPILVRLRVVGQAPDLADAEAWLAENAGVLVARSDAGAPVVFVEGDLATKRGAEALGATVPRGIAIETRQADLVPCVFAHEVLHFLGLHHVDDEADLMHPRCEADKPERATLSADAQDELRRVESIHAITLTGRVAWAERV